MNIHSSAIVSADAQIHPEARVGPFCVIEGRVSIGRGSVLDSNVRIGNEHGRVAIGRNNRILHGAVLGGFPQDSGYVDADTALEVGDGNRIGEYVTISAGTQKGGGVTRVGDDNFIMAYAHLGHDCQLADRIVLTNGAQLAGHVTVEANALVSGLVGVTQFVRIGAYAFITAGSFANKDIAPYTIAGGHYAVPRALNKVGLRRAGFDAGERRNITKAVGFLLDRALTLGTVTARIRENCEASPQIEHLLAFIGASERGVAR